MESSRFAHSIFSDRAYSAIALPITCLKHFCSLELLIAASRASSGMLGTLFKLCKIRRRTRNTASTSFKFKLERDFTSERFSSFSRNIVSSSIAFPCRWRGEKGASLLAIALMPSNTCCIAGVIVSKRKKTCPTGATDRYRFREPYPFALSNPG